MTLKNGSILNQRYRIEGQLGRGGMGMVYLAQDQTLNIRVAIKENLSPSLSAEKQFLREAQLLAGLQHPHLPRVTDYFSLEDRQYLVMDYVEGEDLAARAERSPPTVQEVLGWADDVSAALTFLHTRPQPIIHRDVKPANIKLRSDGSVVLVDFGLAKEFDQSATSTGARGLTPGFSPPEQYGPQPTDSSSDQYSLAATLYSLLAGISPTDSFERLVSGEELKLLRALNPDVPENVEAAILKGLSLEKKDRFPDVESFRTSLMGRLQAKTVTMAEPIDTPQVKPRNWVRVVGGIVGLIVVGIVGILVMNGRRSTVVVTPTDTVSEPIAFNPEPSATTEIPPTEALTPTSVQLEATSTSVPAASSVPQPDFIGGGGRIVFSSERNEKYQYDLYWMYPDGSGLTQLTDTSDERETEVAWSPDGERLVFRSFFPARSDYIYVMNLDGSDKYRIVHANRYAGDPSWSSDDVIVLYEGRCPIDDCWTDVQKMTTELYVINPDGTERTPLTFDLHEYRGPSWSPDNSQIVYSSASGRGSEHGIYIMDADGSNPTLVVTRQAYDLGPEWSPDGEWIAFYSGNPGDFDLYMVRPDGSDLTRLTDNPHDDMYPTWSPDGRYLAFATERDGDFEIYLLEIETKELTRLTHSPEHDTMPAWSR